MKTYSILKIIAIVALAFLASCDPNKELYEQLDELKKPYKKDVEYTLTASDYGSFGNSSEALIIKTNQAFSEEIPAMNYVPTILARRYLALNLKSSARVTYNFSLNLEDRPWEQVAAGYELTTADYNAMGGWVAHYKYFQATIPAKNHLPNYLLSLYPSAPNGTIKTIRYKYFVSEGNIATYADIYQLVSTAWVYIKTMEQFIPADYILVTADYTLFGLSTAYFPNMAEADRILPIWLKSKYPYAAIGTQKFISFQYFNNIPTDRNSLFTFDGTNWVRSTGIVPRTEQYVYGASGWAFDPTVRFVMTKSDYAIIAVNDPIPHPRFFDQGYYFSASGFYGNFDLRLLSFHLRVFTWEGKTYTPEIDDPNLVNIYNTQGADAASAELTRRIVEEGLIIMLQKKFPEAVPQVGGIDVHYIVGFETYNDNLSRSYPEAEYRCTAAASGSNPPQFVLIEGPRKRD
jgi:hypothetical protein